MKCFVLLSALVAVVAGDAVGPFEAYRGGAVLPLPYAAAAAAVPRRFSYATAAADPLIPSVVSTQRQAQDELGNYEYSYANVNSAKHERGNADSGVQGFYAYVDAHGVQRRVDYVADQLGFRATGNNLPVGPVAHAAPIVAHAAPIVAHAAPIVAHAAVPAAAAAAAGGVIAYNSAPYGSAVLTRIENTPGHATSYRVD